ncbi:SET domain-containing protein [Lentinus tigrinus ALCF2SS1-7]|uniref:SET domain-containing protein n=1 Tax=Lentinus tigrinus ALCF2SS1-6 TaxID=1328759 RepID=A0A5C2RWL5_9APHY|nr:SET domain-containing protein [Lentinus tigrinus ALCF2SS1-6]RPD71334.1 SET domain-containing protein [Lentinus tigrinus ALCF2SS1-7]
MGLDIFYTWLSENEVQVLPGVSISEKDSSIAVFSTKTFDTCEKLAIIPKRAVLSTRTCAFCEHISWVPYGHGAILALSLALYSEILRGAQSRWFGYLQSLPASIVPIARLWGHPAAFADDADAQEAYRWLQGTEVQRELQDDEGMSLLTEIDEYYESDVEPLLTSHKLGPSLSGFLRAYSLVCSRAFLVDAYHGLSMVPVADAFNHEQKNHVQLTSEYDVCPECGSLAECPHDHEDTPEGVRPEKLTEDGMDTVDMVAVRPIPAGIEVYNTYGAHLGNAALLARYGFMLDSFETDRITFGWPGSGLVVEGSPNQWMEVYESVKSDVGPVVDVSLSLYQSGGDREEPSLSVNSDGQASLGMFVWAARNIVAQELSSQYQSGTRAATVGLITRTFSVLLQVEVRRRMTDVDADPITDTDALQVLVRTADAIIHLCRARLARMGQPGDRAVTPQLLCELLDVLPPEKFKTRYALEYLLGERAILEACVANWEELRNSVGDASTPGSTSSSGVEVPNCK